jgi:uncharacterized protein with HEPN domain
MRRDSRAYLWDVVEHVGLALDFVRDHSFDEYLASDLLRSAVERKLQNGGEALTQLRQSNPDLALRVGDLRRIVGFRNVLVHGYHKIEHHRVWAILQEDAPQLVAASKALLDELGPPGTPIP